MPHPMEDEARKARSDKLNVLGGKGEYPPEKAARLAGKPNSANAQGDAAREPEEDWTASPARQVSDHGRIRK
jgi:hypothetical protein